jgi:hypothetical protein
MKRIPAARIGSSSPWRLALVALLCFAILYNVSPTALPSLSTGRVALLLLVVFFIIQGRSLYSSPDRWILLLFFPLPYVLVQVPLTGDLGQLSRFLHLALFSFLGANLVARFAGRLDLLLKALLTATTAQAVIIVLSFFDYDYRTWAEATIELGTNIEISNLYRAPGFTSSGGSALSVVQSLGVLAGGLLLHLRRGQRGGLGNTLTLLLMLLCLASCAFVGRTGLMLSLIYLLVFSLASGNLLRLLLILLGIAVPVAIFVLPAIESLLPSSFSADFFLDYVFGFFLTGTDASVTELSEMHIPPLSVETLLGTGLTTAPEGQSHPSGHDSGLVQAYFTLGLGYAVVFYAAYALVLLRLGRWLPPSLQWVLAACFLAIEVKEPYLFKYSGMFVLVACYTLAISAEKQRGRIAARQQHGTPPPPTPVAESG